MPVDIVTLTLARRYVDSKAEAAENNSVSQPRAGDNPDVGTAGQFAVSDGKGGITWKTLVEAEAVSY